MGWKEIWNNQNRVEKIILECLIKANGFESTGKFEYKNWLEYTNILYKQIGIKNLDKIFEFGCGAGAFLYPLYLQKYDVNGIDYSETLIKLAKAFINSDNFSVRDCYYFNSEKLFDVVFCHSIFQYFPNLEFAEIVFKNMYNISSHKLAILDVCDNDKYNIYHEGRMQKFIENGGNQKEYLEKYSSLKHKFYDKEWFMNLGKKYSLETSIKDQNYSHHENAKYRFNVIYSK
mgnify:FL=1